MEQLGLIHTVSRLAPTFADLAEELLPGVETTVIADELLLKQTVRDGSVGEAATERLRGHIAALAAYGVDGVLVTCSSLGVVVDELAAGTEVPVYRVDRPMAERAVAIGSTVGVLATLPTTLTPTTELVEEAARERDRDIEVVSRLCSGAFAALQRGDGARHDAIVAEELDRLAEAVDVVVLAQASMARIAAGRPTQDTPILSSPRLVMERLAEVSAGVA
ncbi:MAG: Asp/Glu/hydantoin racemase [Actinobacteria bacterium]|nr:Asp/Glu/hydantoin racemase [Actinomycetota bacterium]